MDLKTNPGDFLSDLRRARMQLQRLGVPAGWAWRSLGNGRANWPVVGGQVRMTAEVKAALFYVDAPSSTPITCARSPVSKRSRRQAVTSRWPAVSARRLWHTGSCGGL
jgi:hypothetical protein